MAESAILEAELGVDQDQVDTAWSEDDELRAKTEAQQAESHITVELIREKEDRLETGHDRYPHPQEQAPVASTATAETDPQTLHFAALKGETMDEKLGHLAEALEDKWQTVYSQMRSEGKTEFLLPSPADDRDGKEAQLWLAILDADTPTARLVWKLKLTEPVVDGEYKGTYEQRGGDYGYVRETIEGDEIWVSLREQLIGDDLAAYEEAMANGETSYRTMLSETDTEIHYWETNFETGISKEIIEEKKPQEESADDDKIDAAGEYSSEDALAAPTDETAAAPAAPQNEPSAATAPSAAESEAEETTAPLATATPETATAAPAEPASQGPSATSAPEAAPQTAFAHETSPTQASPEQFAALDPEGDRNPNTSQSTASEPSAPSAPQSWAAPADRSAQPEPARIEAQAPPNSLSEPSALHVVTSEAAVTAAPGARTRSNAELFTVTPAPTLSEPVQAATETAAELAESTTAISAPPVPAAVTRPADPDQPAPQSPKPDQGGPKLELPHEAPAYHEQTTGRGTEHHAADQTRLIETAPNQAQEQTPSQQQQARELAPGEAVSVRAEASETAADHANIAETAPSVGEAVTTAAPVESAQNPHSEVASRTTQVERADAHDSETEIKAENITAEAAPAAAQATTHENIEPMAEARQAGAMHSETHQPEVKPLAEQGAEQPAETTAQTEGAPLAEAVSPAEETAAQSAPTWTQTNRHAAADLTDWFADFGFQTAETSATPATEAASHATIKTATAAVQSETNFASAATAHAQLEDTASDLGDIIIPLRTSATTRHHPPHRARQTLRAAA